VQSLRAPGPRQVFVRTVNSQKGQNPMSTKQHRAMRTRDALIEAAARVFEASDYTESRLDVISRGAGVSRGALSFHFASKEAVAEAVEELAAAALTATVVETCRNRDSVLQALVDSTHALARLVRDDHVVRGGLRLNCDPAHRSRASLRLAWERCVRALMAKSAAAGELSAYAVRNDPSDLIVVATAGYQVLGVRDKAWLDPPALTHFWDCLLPRLAHRELMERLHPGGSPQEVLRRSGARPGSTADRGEPSAPADGSATAAADSFVASPTPAARRLPGPSGRPRAADSW
jgi:AcrR family transcriptional regulator